MANKFKKLPLVVAVIGTLHGSSILAAEAESTLSNITVFGRGETRQVSEISKDDILANAPGTSPLLALSILPGVNFNAADSQGNYEWGSRISIRGFSQNQLGFTLDDVPLGDMSYRNYNGLHISRAIASENIGKVSVSQGTGALGTASSSNLGGTIQFYSLDPSDVRGETVDQTFGSYANSRTFVKFDSGLIGDSKTKFSLSFSDQEGNKWKGAGEQIQRKFNSKVVSDFDNGRITAFFNYSDSKQDDYMDLSKDSVSRLGYKLDYLNPNWALAKQLGQAGYNGTTGVLNTAIGNITNQNDSYYDGSGLREDYLAGATLNYTLNDKADIKTTIYHHSQDGTGTWWVPDPRTTTLSGATAVTNGVALRELGFDIERNGILAALNYDFGIHKINTGIWYENNDFNNSMKFFAQENGPSDSLNPPTSGEYYTRWNYNFNTDTIQYHLQDTVKLNDQWTINAGFKSLYAKTDISNNGGADPSWNLNGALKASDGFLPQIGVNFKLDKQNEFFADASQSLAAYRAVVKGGAAPFDVHGQSAFDALKANLHPEESTTSEIGWRYHEGAVETSLTAYHIDFKNRLVALQDGPAIAGNSSALGNVGKATTNGVEAFVAWQPIDHLKWINSATYNDSEYDSNFSAAGNSTVYQTNGKQVVDAPKKIFASKVAYDDGALHGYVGANSTSRRYYTYTNDNSVSGYTLFDLGGGYRWKNVGALAKEVDLHFAVTNLFDRKYYAFGDNPFPASDPTGQSYNLLSGAPRSIYVGLGAKF